MICSQLLLHESKTDNERVGFLQIVCAVYSLLWSRKGQIQLKICSPQHGTFTTGNKVDSYLEPSLSTDSWMKQDLIGPIMISRPQSAISG